VEEFLDVAGCHRDDGHGAQGRLDVALNPPLSIASLLAFFVLPLRFSTLPASAPFS
jgi:hypothetical protein